MREDNPLTYTRTKSGLSVDLEVQMEGSTAYQSGVTRNALSNGTESHRALARAYLRIVY
jgi:hypothetical protein